MSRKDFKTVARETPAKRSTTERVEDWKEIYVDASEELNKKQAARCMDCGVPFCHNGCPLGNVIPAFNDAVYQEDWKGAFEILSSTNNFPEFTGRICPAPCETSCVLGINADPVTIEFIEKSIAERAYEEGWVQPPLSQKPASGKTVAIVGSGPAGLAAAEQLCKAGHAVTVFERNDKIGGLLRYGIPDFKLEKHVIDRKLALMEAAGIVFKTGVNVGEDVSADELRTTHDAVLLCGGSTIARDLPIEGRELDGVHFAMDFLERQNREVAGAAAMAGEPVLAKAKHVVVIGGGDTGADCVGTSNRQGATSVTQIELLAKPPETRDASTPWPLWPMQLRTSTSHEEGCERTWAMLTKRFIGDEKGNVRAVELVDVKWEVNKKTGRAGFEEISGTSREIPCDLALLAVGFVHPQKEGLLTQLGVDLDGQGNVATQEYKTSIEGIYAAGDVRRGQSLVVWAIAEGRAAAAVIDSDLSGIMSELDSIAENAMML